MKATDKIIGRLIVGCVFACCLSRFTTQTFAIEGLQVSVQSTNAVLSWPSDTNETYIVQFRPDLNAGSSWVTLTNFLPPDADTNLTTYTHSNSVQYPVIVSGSGGGGGGGVPLPGGGGTNYSSGGGTNGSSTTGFYRVVRNGVFLQGFQNSMTVSGTVEFPFEFGASTTNGVPSIRLFINGDSASSATTDIGPDGKLAVLWNTAFTANGTYEVYAQCDFDDETIFSITNTVTVDNQVHFVDFTTDFGEQLWVYAELSSPQADVSIDIYSDDGYIGTFSTSTTDGIISFLWDLTDPSQTVLTNETFYGVFNVAATSAQVATKAKAVTAAFGKNSNPPSFLKLANNSPKARTSGTVAPKGASYVPSNPATITWNKQYGWSGDNFVVAWGVTPIINNTTRLGNMIQSGVVDVLVSPAIDNAYTLSPGNTFNGTTYRLLSADKTNLLEYLADPSYRNFYYFGHGNSTRFGDYNEIAGWLTEIEENDVRRCLDNLAGKSVHHPYRFVFLDTCNSASGTLCEAFGIHRITVNRSVYQYNNLKARAFVGYVGSSKLPSTADDYIFSTAMLAEFFAEWRDGADINGIVQRAKQNAYWPLDPTVQIYGAYNLYRYYPY